MGLIGTENVFENQRARELLKSEKDVWRVPRRRFSLVICDRRDSISLPSRTSCNLKIPGKIGRGISSCDQTC